MSANIKIRSKRGSKPQSLDVTQRKEVPQDTRTYLMKHTSEISQQKQLNKDMKNNLNAEKINILTTQQENQKEIKQLKSVGMNYAKHLEIETKRFHDLQKAISQVKGMNIARKSTMGSHSEADLKVLKQKIAREEHYLDMLNTKINAVKASNKVVIKKIDFLRKERSLLDLLYKQLETEICQKNKKLLETIILTDQTREDKIREHQELEDLKRRSRKEQMDFEQKYQEAFYNMQQEYEQEMELNRSQFIKKKKKKLTKDQILENEKRAKEEERARKKKEKWERMQEKRNKEKQKKKKNLTVTIELPSEKSKTTTNNNILESQTLITQQLTTNNESTILKDVSETEIIHDQSQMNQDQDESVDQILDQNEETDIQRMDREIEENNKIMQKIKQDTKMEDLDDIAQVFNTYQAKNEKLYDEVNELSSKEIDLQKEIVQLEKEIQVMKAKNLGVDLLVADIIDEQNVDKEKEKLKAIQLQDEINTLKKETQHNRNLNKQNKTDIAEMYKGLTEIFTELGLNNEKNKYLALEMVNKENCLEYMDVIGKRYNNIILMHEFAEKDEKKEELEEGEKVERSSQNINQEIQRILGNIEVELGDIRSVNKVQNPFNEKMVEAKLQQIMGQQGDSEILNDTKKQKAIRKKKTRFIY